MTQTVNTSGTSYLPVAEFISRVDPRIVGDLCSINGQQLSVSTLQNDARLAAALLDASGDVEAACLRGQRYQPADLAALTGVGQGKLWRLIRDLTMCRLYDLRDDLGPIPPKYAAALEDLERLCCGERIFSFVESQVAGVPAPGLQEMSHRHLTTTRARRFFGTRWGERCEW